MQDAMLSEKWRDKVSFSKKYNDPLLSWRVQRCSWSYHVTNSFFVFNSVNKDHSANDAADNITNSEFFLKNELHLNDTNRNKFDKHVIYVLDQWIIFNAQDYTLWKDILSKLSFWIQNDFNQRWSHIWIALRAYCYTHDYRMNKVIESKLITSWDMLIIINYK
jgi:hypothetical protein